MKGLALVLILIHALSTVACAAFTADERVVLLEPSDSDVVLLGKAVQQWDAQIGFRRPLAYVVDSYPPVGETKAGDCTQLGEYRQVRVFRESVKKSSRCVGKYAECFINVLLHEMAHAHLTCTNEDHVHNPDSTLYPYVTPVPFLDKDTVLAVKEAWK